MQLKLFLFVAFVPSYLLAQVETSLRLDKGRTYHLVTNNKNTFIELNGETETKSVNTEKGEFTYTVLQDLDSLYLVEVEFKHFSLKMESAEKTVSYSSDIDDRTDIVSTILRRITNKPFRVLMKKDYNWKEVYGLDNIFMRSIDDYNLTEDVKQQVEKSMRESMKGYTRQDASLTAVMYGTKKIKPDDIWTSQFITEHVVPTSDSCSYQFSETTGELLVINGSGTVTSLEEEKVNGNISATYHLNGTTNCTMKFYKNSFWVHEAFVKTEISGNAAVKEGASSEPKLVPMRIITEATITGF